MTCVRTKAGTWSVLLAAMLCLVAGCRTEPAGAPDARPAMSRFNWWNYYERGRTELRAGDLRQARADFEFAIGLRGNGRYGYPHDRWRVRTYGVHILENYFPNRELGVCLFELGEDDEAIRYLEVSMVEQPSGRAKHFLNLARQRKLRQVRCSPPTIDLDSACDPVWTRERERLVSGTARGEGLVQDIEVNGERQFVELAGDRVPFRLAVPLREGSNTVRVVATDLKGQVTCRTVTWIADWQPPQVAIDRVDRQGNRWTLHGTCRDDAGIVRLIVDGRALVDASGPAAPVRTSYPFVLTQTGRQPVWIDASDPAGNRLQIALSGDAFAQASGRRVHLLADALDAGAVADAGGGPLSGAPPADAVGPTIRLSGVDTEVTVFGDEYCLDAGISAPGGLSSIAVNGAEMLMPANRGVLQVHLARRVPLAVGTNRLAIVARDVSGRTDSRAVLVIRKIPEYLDRQYRLSVGVVPVAYLDDARMGRRLRECLEQEVLREPARFFLTERPENQPLISRELEVSSGGLADARTLLEVGRRMQTDMLAVSRWFGESGGATLYTELWDVDAGQTLCSEDIYLGSPQDDPSYQVGGLVMKLEQHFPSVAARISDAGRREVTIDAGNRLGIANGTKFLLIRVKGAQDPMEAGSVLLVDQQPAEARVVKAGPESSVAKVCPAGAGSGLQKGHYYVYTR